MSPPDPLTPRDLFLKFTKTEEFTSLNIKKGGLGGGRQPGATASSWTFRSGRWVSTQSTSTRNSNTLYGRRKTAAALGGGALQVRRPGTGREARRAREGRREKRRQHQKKTRRGWRFLDERSRKPVFKSKTDKGKWVSINTRKIHRYFSRTSRPESNSNSNSN